ncbi:Na+/H+ antiporter NhaA [Microlunatus speluncae]|uniref:Na+/H+ antiporter NhaA n=1 Tax=Microlunatus speluncae TaxID=2594267 RepID=UPI0012668475|nr:Na+/H+ antiporter NhaA [Microlunatus speluncae]
MPLRKRIVLFGRTSDADARSVADVLRQETAGGALILFAAAVALIWANLGPDSYRTLAHLPIGPLDLHHWTADGLLTIFFFVAGLELKREFTVGSLSRPANALVPVVAALCGMIIPALIYLLINGLAPGGHPQGWAIPMATDIAFALAVLAVVAPGLPASLRAFLLTLAIVDDLGAILVIAVAFTADLQPLWLLGVVACAGLWVLLQWRRIRGWYLYLPLGILCWWLTLSSGIHATIAGVLLGLLTRARQGDRSLGSDAGTPVDRWEHLWRPVSAGVAVPLFALFSAGVTLSPDVLRSMITEPAVIGIVAGLVLGKTIGVFGGAALTARFTRAQLAPDLRWSEVFSVSILAGIGFTVALLISDLAFAGTPELAEQAKGAVLFASLLAAVLATISLRRRTASRRRAESD